jgi:nucleotide-binding universal stress UspA family protein
MALTEGPLVFLTDGSARSLSALPNVAALAREFRFDLRAVYLYKTLRPKRPLNPRDVEDMRAEVHKALPEGYTLSDVIIAPVQYQKAAIRDATLVDHNEPMQQADRTTGAQSAIHHNGAAPLHGILALASDKQRGILHSVAMGRCELLLRSGLLPVLSVPPAIAPKPIRKILFPVDLSTRTDQVLDHVLDMCRKYDAELHLLHIYGDAPPPRSAEEQAQRLAAKNPRELLEIDKAHIEQLHRQATDSGVSTVVQTSDGSAHKQIVGYVGAVDVDLIVMPSHGPRNSADIFLGSTTVRVQQTASVPVLALRSAAINNTVARTTAG